MICEGSPGGIKRLLRWEEFVEEVGESGDDDTDGLTSE